ncbi:hypothetical protein B0A55_07624 [Friedmanniomyces simplex]|uniref:DUF7907 domain-containing protein n=1 Tax=Friedmanniomyces simplex TaxID=329884 RepID=A0A4U0XAX1_9PEZI|nr:hypothetical protein B0A55_07624 [Friedmanniomyces simplex]
MKSVNALCAALLAFTVGSYAQGHNQSAPFYLNLLSDDPGLNGTGLVPCHTGAAIENLCSAAILNASQALYGPFQFNTTAWSVAANSTAGEVGVLTYMLQGSNFNESEPMNLSYDSSSNIAAPIFMPGYPQLTVAFDSDNRLNIPTYTDTGYAPLYRWYLCDNSYYYKYRSIAWVVGPGVPDDASCCPVGIYRSWV